MQELIKDTSAISRRKLFATPELDRSLVQLGDRGGRVLRSFPQEGRHGFRDQERFLEQHGERYTANCCSRLEALCARLELVQGAIEDTFPLVRRARLIQQGADVLDGVRRPAFVYWMERRGPRHVSAGDAH